MDGTTAMSADSGSGTTTRGSGDEGETGASSSGTDDGGTTGDPACEGPGKGPGDDPAFECDPIAQDCPEGEKCVPAAAEPLDLINATRCMPIPEDPAQVGEPCVAYGYGSGDDTCDVGAVCDVDWEPQLEIGMGECMELCGCSYDNPICEVGDAVCLIANYGALPLCIAVCDPLDPKSCPPGCPPETACVPWYAEGEAPLPFLENVGFCGIEP